MSDDLESWDDDPDFQLPPEGIRLPLSSSTTLEDSSSQASPPHEEQDFFSLLDSKLLDPRGAGEGNAREKTKEDSMNSLASTDSTVSSTGTVKGREDDLTTTANPVSETSVLVSSQESGQGTKSTGTGERETEEERKNLSKMQTIRLGSDLSKLLSGPGGLGGRGRGQVTHLRSTPGGKAVDVGDGDWDQDLDFGEKLEVSTSDKIASSLRDMDELEGRRLNKRTSRMSHLSIDSEDDSENYDKGKPSTANVTNTPAPLRQKVSIDSFRDDPAESNQVSDLDFDLPSNQTTFDISPSLALQLRPSLDSLRSESTEPRASQHHPGREYSTGSNSSIQTQVPGSPLVLPPLSIAPTPSRLSIISTHSLTTSTSPATTTDDEGGQEGGGGGDSDVDFFQDLELPAYFLGGADAGGGGTNSVTSSRHRRRGGGTTTPPTSDGEFSFPETSPSPTKLEAASLLDQQHKIDLQSLLKQKLELRGGRGLLFRTNSAGSLNFVGASSPTKEQLEGLEKHREREEEDHEAGKELSLSQSKERSSVENSKDSREEPEEEEIWNAEEMRRRMRTISGARAREAATAKNSRSGGGGRRTTSLSGGRLPPLPSTSAGPPGRRPTGLRRSETTPVESSTTNRYNVRSGLSRSGSNPSVASQPTHLPSSRCSLPQVVRPSSAQSTHASATVSTRRGPPPAPSTASRDRIRMRTISLRTVGSHSDLSQAHDEGARITRPRSGSSGIDRSHGTTSHPPRAASSPGPTPTLRPRRSQQHLRPSDAPAGLDRPLVRKRSLQHLASTADRTPSRPSSRQNSLRSPSPASSASRRPSFAAPTAASSSRTRERVHSNPPSLATVPASPQPSRVHTTTAAGVNRLLQSTLSSASKTRASPSKPLASAATPSRVSSLRIPSQPLYLSRPVTTPNRPSSLPGQRQRDEAYGDGTELDGFDDLPISKERERQRSIAPAADRRGRKGAGTSSRSSTASSGSSGGSIGRRCSNIVEKGKGNLAPMSTRSRLPIPTSTSSQEVGKLGEKGKDKGGKRKKREPHLIRHLGGNSGVPKVHGEMTYNPILQRWEGNDSILREFDKVLSTSTRPALISPFSSSLASPSRSGFSSPTTVIERDSIGSQLEPDHSTGTKPSQPRAAQATEQQLASGGSRGSVKVVGDMVFDPSTCSWHAIAGPEEEDELELDWGDIADDEQGGDGQTGDGWERGERERMLKNRASFVLSEGEEGSSQEEEEKEGKKGRMTKRGIWRESKRAEERCRQEMKGWITVEAEDGEGQDRAWLFELRALILDSR